MSIERISNLIRALRSSDPERFNMSMWCTCAAACAGRDQYFLDEGFRLPLVEPVSYLADFFGISKSKASELFTVTGYRLLPGGIPDIKPEHVVSKLKLVIMEMRANEASAEIGPSPACEEWDSITVSARQLEDA